VSGTNTLSVSEQAKKALSSSAQAAVALFARPAGLEYSVIRTDAEITLDANRRPSDRRIVWSGPGGEVILAQTPYLTKALAVIDSKELGVLFFMFSGFASALFSGKLLNRKWGDRMVSIMDFTEVESGLLLGHSVPRGVGCTVSDSGSIEWQVFANQDDSEIVDPQNPLFSLLKREFLMHEKSHLALSFRNLKAPRYLQVIPRGGQSICSVGSQEAVQEEVLTVLSAELEESLITPATHGLCLVLAHRSSILREQYNALKLLFDLARRVATPYEVHSGVLDARGSLPRYLALELERQSTRPGEEPLRLNEISSQSEESRGGQILKAMTGREPKLLWPKTLTCPNCKAVYSYRLVDAMGGELECKNCLKRFSPK